MYSIYEPNRVFNHCDRNAKCCLFNSCNNLFPIYRVPALRRISIDRKEMFNGRKNLYLRSKSSADFRFERQRTIVSLKWRHRYTLPFGTKGASIIESNCTRWSLFIVTPREFSEPVLLSDSCTRVRACLMFVKRTVIFHRSQRKIRSTGNSK